MPIERFWDQPEPEIEGHRHPVREEWGKAAMNGISGRTMEMEGFYGKGKCM